MDPLTALGAIVIRKYRSADCEDVLHVWAEASAVAHSFLSREFLEQERQDIPNLYLPQAETWVWEADGRVVGFISLLGNEIGALFVDPGFHRSGIGRALVNRARALRGELEVEVFERNLLGRAFYAKMGFGRTQRKVHEPTGFRLWRLRLPAAGSRGAHQDAADEEEQGELPTMHKSDIVTLVAYTFWADRRVLDACEAVTPEQFVRTVSPDPGWQSLRGTLVHALDTAHGWRTALQRIEDSGVIDESQFANAASLRERWEEEARAWMEYVRGLRDDELNAIWWSHGESKRTRWQTIMHVVNDLTHHRSEAAAMLTGYGQSPGELDFDQYVVDVMPAQGP